MSGRSSLSGQPSTTAPAIDDDTVDEGSICHECRQVDWEGLPVLAESQSRKKRFGEVQSITIRTIETNHEQVASGTSTCKTCRILSILQPEALGTAPWVVLAQRLLESGGFYAPELKGKRGETVTALFGRPRAETSHYGYRLNGIVAIKRKDSASKMIIPKSINYNRLKLLIRECSEHHNSDCNRKALNQLTGLKVVDISSRAVVEAPGGCQYVALSYVWGKQQVHSQEMDLNRPPPLIEDAVSVTSSLGYRYLWIDKYCIPQNDFQERSRMISQMDQVYSSASITIIDASGEDAQSGLPGVSNFAFRSQRRLHIGNTTLLELPSGARDLRRSKWATRGWTYQEGILSPRRLIFTPNQVLYLCAWNHAEESLYCLLGRDSRDFNTSPLRNLIIVSSDPGHRIMTEHPDIIRQLMEYSARDLTDQGDSLNAFLGILNFHTNWQSSTSTTPQILHIPWGVVAQHIGQNELRLHLTWHHPAPAQRRPQFPSWTWAGWGGPLLFKGTGIVLLRPGRKSLVPRHLTWELSWDTKPEYRTPGNIWDLADHVRRSWPSKTGYPLQQPALVNHQMKVTCLVVAVSFEKVSVPRDQRGKRTEIHVADGQSGNGADVVHIMRMRPPPETPAPVLPIWNEVYVAAGAHLDQQPESHDRTVGLVFAEKHPAKITGSVTIGCLLARQVGQGVFERVGIIYHVLECYNEHTPFRDETLYGGIFLDKSGGVLDEVEVSRSEMDAPFKDVGERQTIVLM
ncbi:hypothetical protein KVR01_009168 [Diaporthe batatas]|uniref:uncharacterized protein n=1 Tax=Diaporthe batatas TaxID=748121 RepID=UPI001D03E66F|nr:uncharacterized protein KVR01_009168 [Diaporthe batatas]KAG8160904.1 hypothetical protein KVR01_009168 [Diaporthe batatas]